MREGSHERTKILIIKKAASISSKTTKYDVDNQSKALRETKESMHERRLTNVRKA